MSIDSTQFPYQGAKQHADYVQRQFETMAASVRRALLDRARYKAALEAMYHGHVLPEDYPDHIYGTLYPEAR